jgi:BirA family transcriptional regulator, biotin operon repressor / biotin---[acetyl-CoA-carboxylase] ligase
VAYDARRSGSDQAHVERAGLDARDGQILERLRAQGGQFVSGTELAELLGVSRAAVGKRVSSLRQRGLEIEAVPNRGYRLLGDGPGALQPEAVTPLLTTAWLGRLYLFFDELDSTNDEAIRMAAEGAPHGTVVVADRQRAGRGRLRRSWFSPPGENLYLSMILRPQLPPSATPPLSLATAVGVAEGVRGYVGCPPTVKWPNDLLYGGKKFCGVLIEMSAAREVLKHVVVGVGIDVNCQDFPAELEQLATSLRRERGEPVSRAAVLASVLNSLEPWFDRLVEQGPAPVIEAWAGFAPWIGRRVAVSAADGKTVEGVALGLDAAGALQLRTAAGEERTVISGDVKLLEG